MDPCSTYRVQVGGRIGRKGTIRHRPGMTEEVKQSRTVHTGNRQTSLAQSNNAVQDRDPFFSAGEQELRSLL
eukprot:806680-Pleurochrysis_carterae.AAC.2